jgi:hypothetical protein
VELVEYVVGWDEAVVVGDTDGEPEEPAKDEAEDVDEPGLEGDEEPTVGVVPEVMFVRCAAPVAGPTWEKIIPARASTTITGTAPRAMGRTLSDVRFISHGSTTLFEIYRR